MRCGSSNSIEPHHTIEPGDVIVMLSDGIGEAENRQGSLFGFARVEQILKIAPTNSAQGVIDHVLAEVRVFADTIEPHDDLTIMAVRVGP
ncbi:MAG: hypothetical protein CYG59_05875 [Chloroflexi bacterium]|nr:MAG: hypothetical protein CYG59_05875 [Chloroflexota bacterium]